MLHKILIFLVQMPQKQNKTSQIIAVVWIPIIEIHNILLIHPEWRIWWKVCFLVFLFFSFFPFRRTEPFSWVNIFLSDKCLMSLLFWAHYGFVYGATFSMRFTFNFYVFYFIRIKISVAFFHFKNILRNGVLV